MISYSFQVLDVLRVDDKQFSVAIDMYFGVHWTERRLKLPTFQNGSTQVRSLTNNFRNRYALIKALVQYQEYEEGAL